VVVLLRFDKVCVGGPRRFHLPPAPEEAPAQNGETDLSRRFWCDRAANEPRRLNSVIECEAAFDHYSGSPNHRDGRWLNSCRSLGIFCKWSRPSPRGSTRSAPTVRSNTDNESICSLSTWGHRCREGSGGRPPVAYRQREHGPSSDPAFREDPQWGHFFGSLIVRPLLSNKELSPNCYSCSRAANKKRISPSTSSGPPTSAAISSRSASPKRRRRR